LNVTQTHMTMLAAAVVQLAMRLGVQKGTANEDCDIVCSVEVNFTLQ
jgi:hypothetical protein